MEKRATRGEVPVILAVIVDTRMITEKVFVFEHHLLRCLRSEFVPVVHIVPSDTHLQVKVAQVKADGQEFSLELIVENVIIPLSVKIEIHIVAEECIAEFRTCKTTWMNGNFSTGHHSFA